MIAKQTTQNESKLEELCRSLRHIASSKGPHAQIPTMRELCDELKTTRVTLGEALKQLEAEGILYSKDRQGIFVSPYIHQKSIHVLFNEAFLTALPLSPFWSLLWMRLEQEAQRRLFSHNEQHTFHLVMPPHTHHDEQETASYACIQGKRIDGIISICIKNGAQYNMPQFDAPCVTFAEEGEWIVRHASEEIGRLAAQILLQQGCTKLGIWEFNNSSFTVASHGIITFDKLTIPMEETDTVKSFCQLLSEKKTPIYRELLRQPHLPPTLKTLSFQEQGYLLAHEVFGSSANLRPDGLFINDDLLTDGALVALDELGLQVGKDVKIVTLANVGSPILFGRTRNLTVIEIDPAQIAATLFAVLDTLMSGQQPAAQVTRIRPQVRMEH